MSQTYIYVRYPYYMGQKLQKVCKALSTVSVDTHKFSARVVLEGRAKIHHSGADVKPWQLHINGQKLAALDAEEITAATKMQPAACEEGFLQVMAQHTYHLGFQKSIADECQAAATYLWSAEWQQIQGSNKAWRYAQMLAGNEEMQTMQAYFQISGLAIYAASQAMNQPGPEVFFYTCNSAATYTGDQDLFMSTMLGDTILALDAPFKLSFDAAAEGTFLDVNAFLTMDLILEAIHYPNATISIQLGISTPFIKR